MSKGVRVRLSLFAPEFNSGVQSRYFIGSIPISLIKWGMLNGEQNCFGRFPIKKNYSWRR